MYNKKSGYKSGYKDNKKNYRNKDSKRSYINNDKKRNYGNDKKSKLSFFMNKETLKEVAMCSVTSLILFFVIEWLSRGTLSTMGEFFTKHTVAFFLNILLIFAINGVMFLFKHKKASLCVTSFILLAIGIINRVILEFRGMPIAFMDLFSLGDGLSIAEKFIDLKMIIIVIIVIAVFVAGFIFVWRLDRDKKRFNGIAGISAWLIVVFVFTGATMKFMHSGYLEDVPWNIQESYESKGFLYSLIDSYFGYLREEPEGYSKEAIEKIRAEVDAKEKADKRAIKSEKDAPNILIVQLEGFMDPTIIPKVHFGMDPIPNFRKLMKENTSGYMNVPTTGGGTARTEFEMLTGSNFDYLLEGEIPYTSIVKEKPSNSLATTLKKQGFGVQAIHNFKGNFYNRDKGYKNLGFDTYTSVEYMNGLEYTPLKWPKDYILTEYIKKAMDSTKQKDFVTTISVQGHSNYPTKILDKTYPCKVSGYIPKEFKNQIYYYCEQIREMDEFVKQLDDMLVERKKQTGEDTIVLYYGDHMPKLNYLYGEHEILEKYVSPYAYFSTYKIPKEENAIKESYQIGENTLRYAGVKYGPIEKFHAYMKDDKDFKKKNELVQYDILFGKKYYLKDSEKQKENTLKMGIDEIKIKDVKIQGSTLAVDGENFTESSHIFLNGKKLETTFVKPGRVTAKIERGSVKPGDEVDVKQLGENDVALSSTNEYRIKED